MNHKYSILEYFSESRGSKCGYCKQKTTFHSYGLWAHVMNPADYQGLINRNWRRSGHYCYLPINAEICCPAFAIKCDVADFKLNRSHKKILKRVNRYLKTGEKPKSIHNQVEQRSNEIEDVERQQSQTVVDHKSIVDSSKVSNPLPSDTSISKKLKTTDTSKKSEKMECATTLEEMSSLKPTKKKYLRLQRKIDKLAKKGLTLNDIQKRYPKTKQKTLEDFLNEQPKNGKHKLELELVCVDSEEMEEIMKDTFSVFSKYEKSIHKKTDNKMKDFQSFLVKSPLTNTKNSESPPNGFGSFHQNYYLDGNLIAVGVIDILPECVSSVYFYYDPEYSFLSLGTYASLREIALTKELMKSCPTLKSYYLGYYIPECPKMRYKANLNPSYLLCPEKFTWHLLDEKLKKEIDLVKYKRFNDTDEEVDKMTIDDLKSVLVLANRTIHKYEEYQQFRHSLLKSDRDEVLEYAQKVGKTLACRMLLYRG